ncbi:hypothetical protein PHYBOEH_011753 [Phytophthora boehmeriae]|uniref:ABC-2 type transporter domain-containing protein n=1 Tax=Phytophthora boehmeriae TaxID=109152 RepID=A0A8T1VF47_9STRA|nr:hypothetical protein PHYBOEH_011753 [Phytophthora boehmeriae]
MIDYFESINGVEKLTDSYNPATWILEVIGAGVGKSGAKTTDFVELFKSSVHCERLQSTLNREGVSRPSPSLPALAYSDKRAASELAQMTFLLQRFANMYWRTSSYNLTRFGISLVLGLVFGMTYIDAEYTSYSGINSGLGMLYLAMAFLGLVSFNSMLPVAAEGRTVFYRERAAQTYNAFWYFFGSSVLEIPYVFASVLLFMAVFFFVVGFTGVDAFATMFLALVLHVLLQGYLGELLVFLTPNLEVAQIVGMQISLTFFLYMGFSPPAEKLSSGTKWVYDMTPLTYAFAIIATAVFGDCPSDGDTSNTGCKQMTNVPPSLADGITVEEYLSTKFLMKHDEILRNFGILIGIVLLVRALTLLTMRFINYQKK